MIARWGKMFRDGRGRLRPVGTGFANVQGPVRTARCSAHRTVMVAALAIVCALSASALAATASQAAFNRYYCNQYIAGHNACPEVAVGNFNVNHSYVPHASLGSVCEKVTLVSGVQVSRRCSNTANASSDAGYCYGDLWTYYPTYELVGYAGNNQDLAQYIVGHAFVESECA